MTKQPKESIGQASATTGVEAETPVATVQARAPQTPRAKKPKQTEDSPSPSGDVAPVAAPAAKATRVAKKTKVMPEVTPIPGRPQLDLLVELPVVEPVVAPPSVPPTAALGPAQRELRKEKRSPNEGLKDDRPKPSPVIPPPANPQRPAVDMADRASRYARRPPTIAEDRAELPVAPPLSMAQRAARASQHHRPATNESAAIPAPASGVKPLDMAEIAARNRAARDSALRERRLEIPQALPVPAKPALSMAERAARHAQGRRALIDDAPAEPATGPVATAAPSAAQPPVTQEVHDGPTMAERAATALHKRVPVAEPVPPAAAVSAPAAAVRSTAIAIVTRNHARNLANTVKQWRRVAQQVDMHWWAIDLGSTDDSADIAQAEHLQLLVFPGGYAAPLTTLDAAVAAIGADLLLLVDGDAEPNPEVLQLLSVVRAGHAVAMAPSAQPVAMAIDAQRWRQAAQGSGDWLTRQRHLGEPRCLGGGGIQPQGRGLLAAAVHVRKRERLIDLARSLMCTVRGLWPAK